MALELEITPPVVHDAKHDVDIVIHSLPPGQVFCTSAFIALGLTDDEVVQLRDELTLWLETRM